MGGRFSNSWSLVKASASVLRQDRELIVFPIVSLIASLLVMVSFAVPMFAVGAFDRMGEGNTPVTYLVGFLFYVVQYTIIFFCNTALVGAAMIRLRGGDPTVADGFRIARQRIGPILGYAFIAATVGMILRAIAEKVGIVGRIIISLIGFAWNVATFLVVPVLVMEDVGPADAIKRSTQLLKQTWGEQVIGNAGMGVVFGIAFLVVALIGVPVIMVAIASQSVILIVGAIASLAVALVALGLVNAALTGIYTAAVYQYAIGGQSSQFFSADMVSGAFRQK